MALKKDSSLDVFLGVAYPGSTEKEKDDESDGIHGFPWSTPENDLEQIISRKPWWRVPKEEQKATGRTVRALTCRDNGEKRIYALTKGKVYSINSAVTVSSKKLLDFFGGEARKEAEGVASQDHLAGDLCPAFGEGVLIALYLRENYNPPSYLLHANENLQTATLLADCSPTGKPVREGKNLFVPCGKQIRKLEFLDGRYQLNTNFNHNMKGNILSLACDQKILVCADDLRNYLVIDRATGIESEPLEQKVLFGENSLPTEASSLAITTYKKERYVLFGLSGGKIKIYRALEGNSGKPYLTPCKTQTFLSLDSCMQDIGQDNRIFGLQVKHEWVQFYFRKLYLRMGFPKLLELPEDRVISYDNEHQPPKEYFEKLKECYPINQIYMVPHRATCGKFGGND